MGVAAGQFFTETVTLPGSLSITHTITHVDVTATVQRVYGTQITPLSGTTIYLFTEAGSYMGVSATTDGSGQAMFSLPAISYKLRGDHLSQQYWSAPFVQTDVSIEVPYSVANVHVTDTGADVAGARVYVFNGSSSYLGIYGTTDDYGQVSFDLPAGTYRFRADVSGSQYWTDAVSLIAHQENQVDMPLDLLALTLDPSPDKIFHGRPPKSPEMKKNAKDPVFLASIGSLAGILANLSQTQLPGAVYYFINDHLGTPAKVVDDDGTMVWDADYLPFGETNVLTGTYDNKFRFLGHYLDDETGWHYNYHRYYESTIGRYLRSDPIGFIRGFNLYGYVHNNPINFIDQFGLQEYNYGGPDGWQTFSNALSVTGGPPPGVQPDPAAVWNDIKKLSKFGYLFFSNVGSWALRIYQYRTPIFFNIDLEPQPAEATVLPCDSDK